MKAITKKQYMSNSSELHHDYYAQFVTELTKRFVLKDLTPEQIQAALDGGDKHLNDIKIPFNHMSRGGDWWWDYAPINIDLWRELEGKAKNVLPSLSTRTCVGKAAARIIANEYKSKLVK